MSIAYGDEEFTITVPDGMQGGDVLQVDLPVSNGGEVTKSQVVMVVVPNDCFVGDAFTVDLDGLQFTIGVPDGCGPGDEIQVEVPQEEAPDEAPSVACTPATPEELVGRRAKLSGCVAKAILNGKKGFVHSYDPRKGTVLVSVDGMCPDVSLPWENLTGLPDDDEPDPDDDEPLEAPPAGIHYVGDRVLVERSNGGKSVGTIIEYDEGFETYTIDIGRGLLKYGVEESYITPHETSSVWAGPSTRAPSGSWEGYFVGRRVRIPAMLPGSDDDDKNGEVVGYDARTGFYRVELDSGKVRTSVLFRDIKVLYQLRDD